MRSSKPRLIGYIGLICLSFAQLSAQSRVAVSASVSSPAYGNCPAPQKQGVTICAPELFNGASEIAAPFQVIASGTSSTGQVKLMELWVDGKKITQTAGTPFDRAVTLDSGTHELTVVELDVTGAFVKSSAFKVTVDGNDEQPCDPSTTPGVKVCDPQPNSCHTAAWTTVSAAGTPKSGTVVRMELWINGSDLANFAGNHISTNLYVADFSNLTIIEVDSNGGSIKSSPIIVQSC